MTIKSYKVLDVRERQETEMILCELGKKGYKLICAIPQANRESFIVLEKEIVHNGVKE